MFWLSVNHFKIVFNEFANSICGFESIQALIIFEERVVNVGPVFPFPFFHRTFQRFDNTARKTICNAHIIPDVVSSSQALDVADAGVGPGFQKSVHSFVAFLTERRAH